VVVLAVHYNNIIIGHLLGIAAQQCGTA